MPNIASIGANGPNGLTPLVFLRIWDPVVPTIRTIVCLVGFVGGDPMEYELRRNRIRPGHLEEFLAAWLGGVVPLRRRFGFTFGGAWIVEGTGELVWILGYDGSDGFDAADERYYSSAERAALDPDPAQWFESAVQERMRTILDPD